MICTSSTHLHWNVNVISSSYQEQARDVMITLRVADSPVGPVMAIPGPSQRRGARLRFARVAPGTSRIYRPDLPRVSLLKTFTPQFVWKTRRVSSSSPVITTTVPSEGVLVGFEEDSTVIELLPGIVATMEAWKIVYDEQTGPLEVG